MERRKRGMGPAGLAEAGRNLSGALAARREIPQTLLGEDVEPTSIRGLEIPDARLYNHSSPSSPPGGFDLGRIPFRFYLLDMTENNYVTVRVDFDYQ